MFVPIGTDRASVRRAPVVTLGIIGLCTFVFVLTTMTPSGSDARFTSAWAEATQYWNARPYLIPPADIVPYVDSSPEERQKTLQERENSGPPAGLSPEEFRQQQSKLRELCRLALAAMPPDPLEQWGLSRRNASAITLVTHMFMHANWEHLFFNMLFFFVVAPLLEDAWGRVAFGGFYVLSGLVSAVVDPLLLPDDGTLSIGASGAISGVMGAFAVRFWNVRLCVLATFFPLYKKLWFQTWLIMSIWFLLELLSIPSQLAGDINIGVLAHVSGFAFGALFALWLRKLDAEARWLEPAIRARSERRLIDNLDLERALRYAHGKDRETAWENLKSQITRSPRDVNVVLAFWSLALDLDRACEAAPPFARMIEEEIRLGQRDLALDYWRELRSHAPGVLLAPASQIAIAVELARRGRRFEAVEALRLALDSQADALSSVTLLRAAAIAEDLDLQLAGTAASKALQRMDLDPGQRADAERLLARTSRATIAVPSSVVSHI